MHIFLLSALAAVSALVSAKPVHKRALSDNDTNALQLALYLEHLELSLYSEGCNVFTDAQFTAAGFPAGFHSNICVIANQEAEHAATITSILQANGVSPVPTCNYTFPYSDPTSFVSLANMITTVGLGAYLGGSEQLTDSDVLEVAAGSILAVEARHDTYLRTGLSASPFPTSFDTGLSAVWAFNLAQMFVVSCPQQLPIVRLPKLNVTTLFPIHLQPAVTAGTMIHFDWDPSTFFVTVAPNAPLYIAMVNQNISAPVFQPITKTSNASGSVPVPAGFGGIAFACLTTFGGGLTLDQLTSFGTLAGPVEVLLS